ncbi:unnamed protein product [Allacma fusca]|uniref:Uncharacterized protein n=1 Tax=Allacma fusca TaxID=39272 RepID=A0A8J2NKH2_9HEXA|nr:unnamed protein product [Allacma fusca]
MEEAISQMKNAITSGRTDVINTVLEGCMKLGPQGAELKEKILSEQTVPEGTFLHLATKLGLQDVVRALLIAGADPLSENKEGENSFELTQSETIQQVYVEELLRATAASNLIRMDQLIRAGLDPNSWDCDEKRNSVLHWAVSFANAETIAFLIERGAEVNCETRDGVTPLHDAVDRGDVEIVEILLKNNASPLIKAEKGKFADQSPLDLASKKPEIFSLMSHFLASQFKTRTKRSSMESIYTNGPESPFLPKENYHSPTADLHTSSHGDYVHIHNGFNSTLENVIRGLELKAPIQPIVTDASLSLLWPQPKSLHQLEGLHFRPEKTLHVSVVRTTESVHRILDVFSIHKDVFECLGFDVVAQQVEGFLGSSANNSSCNHSSHIQCCINTDILHMPQSYRLHISSQRVRITASDLQGLNYAICTFLQLLTLYSEKDELTGIPPLIINDHPSLKHRAVFIDVSQERIPTIESLFELIKLYSLLKINFLHLHTRFDRSGTLISYTKGEIVAIDRHCLDSGITLVPAIDVVSGICAAEYFQYIKPAVQSLLPCFASTRYVHVGPVLTSLIFLTENECLSQGADFTNMWNFIPIPSADSVIMLCYNALKMHIANPGTLVNVPANVILVDYGFQADYNFGPSIQELTQSGCTTCVCAGTSAWSSLSGCPEASLCNIYHGTLNAVNNSSMGLIVANWSGSCNITPKPFAWPGFLLGSGLAWNHQTHWEYLQGSLAKLMSMYVLKDPSGVTGQVILQLGCTESNLLRAASNQSSNDMSNLPPAEGTTLYRLLTDPDNVPLDHLTMEPFIKCIRSIKKCQTSLLLEAKLPREDNPVFDELCLTMELMLLACRIGRSLLAAGMNPRSNMGLTVVNLGISNLEARIRTDIANKLLLLTDEYRRVWLLRNYPQGLETSLYTLTSVLQRFIPDSTRLLTGRLISSPYRNGNASINENGLSHDAI